MIKNKICFALEGSLIDLVHQQIPNFNRPAAIWQEKEVNNSLQIYPVGAYYPAIAEEDGSWTIEPDGVNLVSWNLDLSKSVWLKGSNVIIFPDEIPAADNSYLADRVVFATGYGATQSLKRSFSLKPGTDYFLSWIVALAEGSQASSNDVIRIQGDVAAIAAINLNQLNGYGNRYRLLSLNFKTAGNLPQLPNYSHTYQFVVQNITANSVTLLLETDSVVANQFVGARVAFSDVLNNFYTIIANTASDPNRAVTLTFSSNTLIQNGVTTASIANLQSAPEANIELELYVTSTLALNWSGIQIEERSFRTSMIFQGENLNLRSRSILEYRRSPWEDLRTCGVFIDIKEWRGDGVIFEAANFKASIVSSKLVINAGSANASLDELLPKSVKIFIQISQENNNLSIYINKVLKIRTNLPTFLGAKSSLKFTSEGMRCYNRFFVTDKLLLDGRANLGSVAGDEVGILFDSPTIIDAVAISANAPLINLAPITVPGKEPPIAMSRIVGLNTTLSTVTVMNGTYFVADTPVSVVRDNEVILRPRINAVNSQQLILDMTFGIRLGDILVYGNVDRPGTASARFPFIPIDQQKILEIDVELKRLKVSSSLSYTRSRAFIQTSLYEDIAEVVIEDIDNNNGYLFVDSIEGISFGNIISQAESEMIIDPPNYFYGLITPTEGIKIGSPHSNGVILYNYNLLPRQCQPYIRVYY